MLRRKFIQMAIGVLTLPLTPFPNTKKKLKNKIDNSALIKRLLKEKKDFTITDSDGNRFNIIRRKKGVKNLLEKVDKACRIDNNLPSNKSSYARWKSRSQIGKRNNKYHPCENCKPQHCDEKQCIYALETGNCKIEDIQKPNQKFIDE